MPTVCAVSGHAFAAGAILTCTLDFRFMRSDRGFFCLPEVDLGIPFLPGELALLLKAIPQYKMEELQYAGKRATAEELEAHNVIIKACHLDDLMTETMAFAQGLNKRRVTVAEMKQRMYRQIVHVLDVGDPPVIDSCRFHY